MPRPKTDESRKRKAEKVRKKNEKIKQKASKRGLAQSRESQDKIKKALGNEVMTFTELKNATMKEGLGDKAFKDNLEVLVAREEFKKLQIGKKQRFLYLKNNIKAYESLEFFAIEALGRALRETGDSTAEFNQHLGSFITYVLTHYSGYEAHHVLKTVLTEVQEQITKPAPENDQRKLLRGIPAVTYSVESPQWAVWKAIDSTNYITHQTITKNISIKEKKKKNQKETYQLPCSGRCICDKASDGCMNRLLEAKLKSKKPCNQSETEQVIEQEVFNTQKFEKEWLSVN